MSDTVRVRIAVAVNEKGDWESAGFLGATDSMLARQANESHADTLPTTVHFIEADVPLPKPQTIEGEVRDG